MFVTQSARSEDETQASAHFPPSSLVLPMLVTIIVLVLVATTHALVGHMYVDPAEARLLTKRWKPQLVGTSLVSMTGMHPYTRALITISNKRCTGMIFSEDSMAYVMHGDESRKDGRIVAILWNEAVPSVEPLRNLRAWYEDLNLNVPDTEGLDAVEEDLWNMSCMDA